MPIKRHVVFKGLPGRLVRVSGRARLALRQLAALVVSFESLFVLFLFSGAYRLAPALSWIPVNLTVVFMAASALVGLYLLWRRSFVVRCRALVQLLCLLALFAYIVLSLLWTPGQDYARDKVLAVVTVVTWSACGSALIVSHEPVRLKRFVGALLALATVVALASLGYTGGLLIPALGVNYLNVGRLVGMGVLCALAYLLFDRDLSLKRLLALALLLLLAWVLLSLKGRAPVLATAVAALVPLLGIRWLSDDRLLSRGYEATLLAVLALVVLLLLALLLLGAHMPLSIRRALRSFTPASESDAVRAGFYRAAVALWWRRPLLGYGVGSFGSLYVGMADISIYPHNLILEILVEHGLLGLALFMLAVCQGWRALGPVHALRNDPWRMLVLMLFVHAFVNAMFSGDIPGNRVLFAMMGLMTGFSGAHLGAESGNRGKERLVKVGILTSVHIPWDARIFFKQAQTLAKAGYEVVLIAQNDAPEQLVEGVRVLGLPKTRSRWQRPLNWIRLVRRAINERADIYHFHDPELLPWGLLIQWMTGKPVIYDAHEHYAAKIMVRAWIPQRLRPCLRDVVAWAEPFIARRLAATVTADHRTAEELGQRGVGRVVTLYNYPLASICPAPRRDRFDGDLDEPVLIFVGTLGPDRGLWVMLETVACLVHEMDFPVRLLLVGGAKVPGLQERIEQRIEELDIAQQVRLVGYVPHEDLGPYLEQAHLGFLAHDPLIYERNIPTKLFEYMAAGLPIITTRATMTAYFLEQVPAGIMIDSQEPRDYARAIVELWRDKSRLQQMARAGRQAFEMRFNWESEGAKLLALYRDLLGQAAPAD